MRRREFVRGCAGVAIAVLAGSGPALAAKPEIFTDLVKGVAVGGYDPVAYFTSGKAVKGDPAISLVHGAVEWRFSTPQNRDAFKSMPDKYAPKYGGYCAYAAAKGYTAKGDPQAWNIHDGKLYLNYNKAVRLLWRANRTNYIRSAEKNWPGILK
jgi:hypothetical protein